MYPFVETIRIEGGRAYNLPLHAARMNQTRKEVFGLVRPLDLAPCLSALPYEERTKCRVEYAETILKVEYISYRFRPVRTLQWVENDAIDYTYKSTDRQAIQRLFATRGNSDDILIVRDGQITDTSICNVALWNGEEWITPAIPLLAGTHRAYLLSIGQIRPGTIRKSDLPGYSRIRLFNALIPFGEIELPLTALRGL